MLSGHRLYAAPIVFPLDDCAISWPLAAGLLRKRCAAAPPTLLATVSWMDVTPQSPHTDLMMTPSLEVVVV